eukprot:6716839-Ditylum_brightwellii.AAC.1
MIKCINKLESTSRNTSDYEDIFKATEGNIITRKFKQILAQNTEAVVVAFNKFLASTLIIQDDVIKYSDVNNYWKRKPKLNYTVLMDGNDDSMESKDNREEHTEHNVEEMEHNVEDNTEFVQEL